MNAFEQYANNDEQQLIDDLFTIRRSLKNIFNINDARYYGNETDNFKLAINGMDNLHGRLNRDKTKIVFTASGLDKFQIGYDDKKSIENVRKNLIPKMKLKPSDFTIGRYSQMSIKIEFDSLTDDVIHDIMLLANSTKAVLRPKNVRSF
jgi:hypothetical protein